MCSLLILTPQVNMGKDQGGLEWEEELIAAASPVSRQVQPGGFLDPDDVDFKNPRLEETAAYHLPQPAVMGQGTAVGPEFLR